jgi:hypothetical protein
MSNVLTDCDEKQMHVQRTYDSLSGTKIKLISNWILVQTVRSDCHLGFVNIRCFSIENNSDSEKMIGCFH